LIQNIFVIDTTLVVNILLFVDIFSQICDQNGHMVAWKFREYLQEVLVLPSAVYESPSFHYSDQISAEIFSGVKYILVILMYIFCTS